ncbi:hypothetical protein DLP05_073 [Stenotrophomonas phage vB_SmaS_DLP_5]|uniref:Uncharacterized protein n=1 Tax=Stenotrophomonas phage vB_SmaS_DLP_5 TaxID=2044561 RepID=A0A2D2W2F4_9CAUD|nr:hypothetical protein FDJ07_gp148 [Stenotrophomonas phage vB_SmaS_DLP_5]ATS92313.1 hypothetical protein DLP05_073 [Stenotrophomonas phage vB_SmaS_DLP_5]
MDKKVQAALSAKIDVRGEDYTVEQALLSAHGHFAPEDLIKAILDSQKPEGFIVTGLSDSELVSKLQEVGHAESVRDILVSRIGVPAHTVLIDEMTYANWKTRYNVETLAVNGEAYWYWQGDKEDYPESLTCPVIMSAEQLREMLGNANRYKTWRDSMIAHLLEDQLVIQQALPEEVGESRPPTAQEWDKAIDALRAVKESGKKCDHCDNGKVINENSRMAESCRHCQPKCIWPDCGHDTNRVGYGAEGCNGVGCVK